MCGIAGHLDWQGVAENGGVEEMIRRQKHRGPDDMGIWKSPDGLAILGHARLSIVDLSPAGHQPMIDSLTGNTIVFNGEIYNFLELRAQCEAEGERFSSHTDTEVILALYRKHGTDCLRYLRGMFAFALWDSSKRQLFLARDRVGKKPLNYAVNGSRLIFSSEIDPLARHAGVNAEMDSEALELYLQLQYVPAPWTIYKAIRKLPPAHYAIFNQSGLFVQPYWDIDYRNKTKLSEVDALDGLEEKLRQAIKLRMIADVPLGALLSGGVDSSLIVALMSEMSGEPIKTYSIGFKEEDFNELPYAKMVADRYGTEHCPQIIGGKVGSLLDQIVRHYGEPYADSSAVPSFQVCQAAHNHVTVVMNGDGGDELLGGYPRYTLSSLSQLTGSLLGNLHSPADLATMLSGLEKAQSIPARLRRKWLLRFAHPELQSAGLMYAAFWNDKERNQLLGAGSHATLLPTWRETWLANARARASNPIDRMLWIDNRTYLPGDLLVKMDIAAMHCSLEARSPLLDHEVIEYCANLPTNLKVQHGQGKYLLKKLGERYLPHNLIYRRKMGFAIPLAGWLKGELKPLLDDVLTDRDLMSPFVQSSINQVRREFSEHGVDHSSRLWALLMFGLWQRSTRKFDQ